MVAQIVQINDANEHAEHLNEAARLLRAGEIVAFPTETVYGLGANALDAEAVGRIFTAKGRPATNPVIVHVPTIEAARALVREWPPEAEQLAQAFWPGPLTLVLKKSDRIPDVVTANSDTVAVRIPANEIALALLHACDLPLAAPSANPSSSLSPTTAQHVVDGLGERIPLILDGGTCSGGIESTVVAIRNGQVDILRPGLISQRQLEKALGKPTESGRAKPGEPLQSPGLLERHYCPRASLRLTNDSGRTMVDDLLAEGKRVGWMPFSITEASSSNIVLRTMPENATDYAADLYKVLHEMDAAEVDAIVCEMPPVADEWTAIRDRLRRAAS